MRKQFLNLIFLLSVICIFVTTLCSCSANKEREYYSNAENYIVITGTVTHIQYNEDSTALYLGFSDLSAVVDDTNFKIVGKNLQIVKSNGIDDKLKVGDQVSFITAPKYFGDGYVMPIVGITVGDEVLLDFEEGYANFKEQWE